MKITIIYGSIRHNRQGIKAARFIEKKLKERNHEAILIDPKEYELPLLNKMYKEYTGDAPKIMEELHNIFQASEGFIICSGEYNHSIPPVLKNILDHFQKEYLYKTAGIVTYSAGPFAGMRVAVHLRAILGELGMITIPTLYGISAVQEAFDEKGNALVDRYEKNIDKFLDEFEWYAGALNSKRK